MEQRIIGIPPERRLEGEVGGGRREKVDIPYPIIPDTWPLKYCQLNGWKGLEPPMTQKDSYLQSPEQKSLSEAGIERNHPT